MRERIKTATISQLRVIRDLLPSRYGDASPFGYLDGGGVATDAGEFIENWKKSHGYT
jgi:hypothetical protein